MTGISGRAGDGIAARARAGKTLVGLGAAIVVIARGAVRSSRIGAKTTGRVARACNMTGIRRSASDARAEVGRARVRLGAGDVRVVNGNLMIDRVARASQAGAVPVISPWAEIAIVCQQQLDLNVGPGLARS